MSDVQHRPMEMRDAMSRMYSTNNGLDDARWNMDTTARASSDGLRWKDDELPPSPAATNVRRNPLDRGVRCGIALAVAGVIVPQYIYVFTGFIGGPTDRIIHDVVSPAYIVGLIIMLILLIVAPIKFGVAILDRARSAQIAARIPLHEHETTADRDDAR